MIREDRPKGKVSLRAGHRDDLRHPARILLPRKTPIANPGRFGDNPPIFSGWTDVSRPYSDPYQKTDS
jgi:hypothetical protein